jgi:hypothetical protein
MGTLKSSKGSGFMIKSCSARLADPSARSCEPIVRGLSSGESPVPAATGVAAELVCCLRPKSCLSGGVGTMH